MKGYYQQGSYGGPHGLCALQVEEGSHAHSRMLLCIPNQPPEHPPMVQQLRQVHSSDGRTKEQVVEHQRTGAPPLHALCGPVLHGQHGPQLEGTWPAHDMDQAPKLLPLEGSQAPTAPTLPSSARVAGPSRTYGVPQCTPTATEAQ